MDQHPPIYVAGHRGLVGTPRMRNLQGKGYPKFIAPGEHLQSGQQHG
jgi:hypothetical protein